MKLYHGSNTIVGGVADDRVYYAVDMYYQGLWDMERTLEALRFYGVNDQWCFARLSMATILSKQLSIYSLY